MRDIRVQQILSAEFDSDDRRVKFIGVYVDKWHIREIDVFEISIRELEDSTNLTVGDVIAGDIGGYANTIPNIVKKIYNAKKIEQGRTIV